MACLLSLPPELLNQIFQYFTYFHDLEDGIPVFLNSWSGQSPNEQSWYSINRGALCNLSLTCRKLHILAEPYLYNEFAPGFGDSWRSLRFSWDRRCADFARTIIARPDLATHVRRLCLHHLVLDAMTTTDLLQVVPAAVNTLKTRAPSVDWEPFCLTEAQNNPGMAWTPRDRRQLRVDVAMMLTFLMPNLEHLTIYFSQYHRLSAPCVREAYMSQHQGFDVSRHEKLRRLDLAFENGKEASLLHLNLAIPVLLATFQHLGTLNLHRICHLGLSSRAHNILPNLRALHVTQSSLYATELANLLAYCPNVEHIFYESGPPVDYLHAADFAFIVCQMQDLRRLRHIHLDLRLSSSSMRRFGESLPMTGFATLPTLRTLFLDVSSWRQISRDLSVTPDTLAEMLPRSIETLKLAHPLREIDQPLAEDLDRELRRLADLAAGGRFPMLRLVRHNLIPEVDLGQLVGRFAARGISLKGPCYPWEL